MPPAKVSLPEESEKGERRWRTIHEEADDAQEQKITFPQRGQIALQLELLGGVCYI